MKETVWKSGFTTRAMALKNRGFRRFLNLSIRRGIWERDWDWPWSAGFWKDTKGKSIFKANPGKGTICTIWLPCRISHVDGNQIIS